MGSDVNSHAEGGGGLACGRVSSTRRRGKAPASGEIMVGKVWPLTRCDTRIQNEKASDSRGSQWKQQQYQGWGGVCENLHILVSRRGARIQTKKASDSRGTQCHQAFSKNFGIMGVGGVWGGVVLLYGW